MIVLLWFAINIQANAWWGPTFLSPVDSTGNRPKDTGVKIDVGICQTVNSERIELEMSMDYDRNWFAKLDKKTQDLLLCNAGEEEYIIMFGLKSDDQENPYPEIARLKIQLETNSPVGHWRSTLLGKNYRAFYLEHTILEEIAVDAYDSRSASFTVDRLGLYVFYYNPKIYNVTTVLSYQLKTVVMI